MPKIEITKEQADALARGEDVIISQNKELEVESKKEWPRVGDMYWFVGVRGNIYEEKWQGDGFDIGRAEIRNLFRTKEEAKKEAELRKAIQRVKDYIQEEFGEFKPKKEDCYLVYYDIDDDELSWDWHSWARYYSPYGYVKSEEDVIQLIEDCEDDLLLIHKKHE